MTAMSNTQDECEQGDHGFVVLSHTPPSGILNGCRDAV